MYMYDKPVQWFIIFMSSYTSLLTDLVQWNILELVLRLCNLRKSA